MGALRHRQHCENTKLFALQMGSELSVSEGAPILFPKLVMRILLNKGRN